MRNNFHSSCPSRPGSYYPSDYYPLPSSADDLARMAQHERYKIDLVTRYVARERLLEIGPGAGGFAYREARGL